MISWDLVIKRIEPVIPKAGAGCHSHLLERMLSIHFTQIRFDLSDPQAEVSRYDIESMRRFAGIELESDAIPDESKILHFLYLLKVHHLDEQIFAGALHPGEVALVAQVWHHLRCDDQCGGALYQERRYGAIGKCARPASASSGPSA